MTTPPRNRTATESTPRLRQTLRHSPVDGGTRQRPGAGGRRTTGRQPNAAQHTRDRKPDLRYSSGLPARTGNSRPSADRCLGGRGPFNRDSGTLRGKRTVWGGRAKVRKALYMRAMVASRFNPVIRDFYQRMLSGGKRKKLALTACMRKLLIVLNSMLNYGSSWNHSTTKALIHSH